MSPDPPTPGPTTRQPRWPVLSLRGRFALLSLLVLLPLANVATSFWFSIARMRQVVAAAAGRSGTGEVLLELEHVSAQVRLALVGSVLVGLVVALIVGRMLSRAVLLPLMRIRLAAEGFGAGDLSRRVDLRRNDEFGTVARAFDAMADALTRQVLTDDLTGLPNRRAMHDQLEHRTLEQAPALLLLDLDGFKEVNDGLGHDVGDQLLRQIAPRFAARLRPDDLLVRLGGDEFAVLLGPDSDPDATARRLVDSLAAPFQLGAVAIRAQASVGVAQRRASDRSPTEVLQRADVAMYDAKRRRVGVVRYDGERHQPARDRLRTVGELRLALSGDQLVLHYQPQIELATGRVIGVEALVRWQHPCRGLLMPDVFLPLVEQSGLMPALTTRVLRLALEQCSAWDHDGLALAVSVNMSASGLLDPSLPRQVRAALELHGVEPARLTLELTEDVFVDDPDAARLALQQLRALGVRLSVDDYGTGYCSLSYLRDLPVDELKLDRSFAMSGVTGRTAAIVGSTVELAHALGLTIVAEGVEDADSAAALEVLGCDVAQGYHLGRPGPAETLSRSLPVPAARVPSAAARPVAEHAR